MSLRTDAFYRHLAQQTLKKLEVSEPPVPVAELAWRMAVPIRVAYLPTWFSGAIVHEDGLPVILLNVSLTDERQRKTLAHLLSHLILLLEEPDTGYPRNLREHREAEVMAAEMLLPATLVMEQARKWFNDYRYLSRLFGVPEAEMLEKMRETGILKGRNMHWDY